MTHAEIIGLIKQEVKPALGCTEPIAVALAVAKAAEIISENCPCCGSWRMKADFKLDVAVSGNILKNGMGVGIPGTGMVGLPVAAALGAVCGNSSLGLEVLKELTPEAVARAKELVAKGFVHISVADTEHLLYVKATVTVDDNTVASAEVDPHAYAVIEDDHDRIVETSFADKILMSSESAAGLPVEASESPYDLTVQSIWNFAREAPYEDIAFILEDRTLNLALAEEGLRGNYGLQVGKAIRENQKEVFGDDFMSYAMGMTAAASDARMAGSTLPAMSNSGSGNQGITVSMPVIAYALKYKVPDEKLARALILSNLVAIHIKHFLGKLSALCGCVVASTGSACGIVYLEGGGYEQVCAAIKNMAGNITGMVCDGAKVGCAMKVASGVSCAVQSAVLALRGTCIPSTDGIIEDDVEKTIRNIGTIGSAGMKATDRMILEIMLCK
ncbi:MAG: L-serine ammonia-lyase, iron-sulfur-dependent, subunit alpha [Candidatus Cryptobacteroides sp.]|nr:L-serine ammonia-lyase, iron-sulfur-dependent, subunit alpha [Candidatus Cryptobacteroides sp.]